MWRRGRPVACVVVFVLALGVGTPSSTRALVGQDDLPVFEGPYLGQEPPNLTPVKFTGELLHRTICSVFSPDGRELYFCREERHLLGGCARPRRIQANQATWELLTFQLLHRQFDFWRRR